MGEGTGTSAAVSTERSARWRASGAPEAVRGRMQEGERGKVRHGIWKKAPVGVGARGNAEGGIGEASEEARNGVYAALNNPNDRHSTNQGIGT